MSVRSGLTPVDIGADAKQFRTAAAANLYHTECATPVWCSPLFLPPRSMVHSPLLLAALTDILL